MDDDVDRGTSEQVGNEGTDTTGNDGAGGDAAQVHLEDLVERTKAEAGYPFRPEVLNALLDLKEADRPAFETLLGELRKVKGFRAANLEKEMKEFGAARYGGRHINGNTAGGRSGTGSPGGGAGGTGAGVGAAAAAVGGAQIYTRPILRVEPHKYSDLAEEVERAIVASDLPVYAGSDGLVYLALKEVETELGVNISATRLIEVGVPMMRRFMDKAARFEKFNVRSSDWVLTKPPKDIAELLVANKGFWPYPEVIGIISAPTIGMDGEVISKPGLDRRSKLLLSGAPVVAIKDWPIFDDAMRALKLLEDLLTEYQVDGPASRAVALSMLITPLLRGLLPLVPLHVVSAPVAGSGKSYLASLASAIATGYYCPVIPPSKNEEEFEKRLIGSMLGGATIISFDNVNGTLENGTLCQALEQRVIEVRPLGTSKTIRIEQRINWFANGNNIEVTRDLTRRTLYSRVNRKEERPELHKYESRPFETIVRNRAKYIAAALTIVRAYIVAGHPGKLQPLASYEPWSDNVRSALAWLGQADCCDSMTTVREGDTKLQGLRTLFSMWASELGLSMEYTSRTVIEIAERRKAGQPGLNGQPSTPADAALWDAIYDCCGVKSFIDAKVFGEYLRKHKDHVLTIDFPGRVPLRLQLERGRDTHTKVATWKLDEI